MSKEGTPVPTGMIVIEGEKKKIAINPITGDVMEEGEQIDPFASFRAHETVIGAQYRRYPEGSFKEQKKE